MYPIVDYFKFKCFTIPGVDCNLLTSAYVNERDDTFTDGSDVIPQKQSKILLLCY